MISTVWIKNNVCSKHMCQIELLVIMNYLQISSNEITFSQLTGIFGDVNVCHNLKHCIVDWTKLARA